MGLTLAAFLRLKGLGLLMQERTRYSLLPMNCSTRDNQPVGVPTILDDVTSGKSSLFVLRSQWGTSSKTKGFASWQGQWWHYTSDMITFFADCKSLSTQNVWQSIAFWIGFTLFHKGLQPSYALVGRGQEGRPTCTDTILSGPGVSRAEWWRIDAS